MAKFRIKPGSKKKAQDAMQEFAARKKKAVSFALGFWMDDTVAAIQAELLAVGAFDQGLLSAATTRDPVREDAEKLKCRGHNDLEYASVMEWGRLPHAGTPPPLLPLVGWAVRKQIIHTLPVNISFDGQWAKQWAASGAIFRAIHNDVNRGRRGTGDALRKTAGLSAKKKPIEPQVLDMLIVRSIANKIFEKGIAGRHPFSRVWDRRAKTITKDIAALVNLQK